jgi:hypothetical protein
MEYDYTGVTEIRHDRDNKRLELVVAGKRVTVENVDRLYLKGVPWVEADGTARLNRGRVSIGDGEAVAGD